jgi:hypothetical protein
VLTGAEPARDPSTMTPAEQEDFISSLEKKYVPKNE